MNSPSPACEILSTAGVLLASAPFFEYLGAIARTGKSVRRKRRPEAD